MSSKNAISKILFISCECYTYDKYTKTDVYKRDYKTDSCSFRLKSMLLKARKEINCRDSHS